MSLLENVLALKMFVKFRNCVITLCETAAWQIFIPKNVPSFRICYLSRKICVFVTVEMGWMSMPRL